VRFSSRRCVRSPHNHLLTYLIVAPLKPSCALRKDGELFKDPAGSCSLYYSCTNGTLTNGTCAPGTALNVITQNCTDSHAVIGCAPPAANSEFVCDRFLCTHPLTCRFGDILYGGKEERHLRRPTVVQARHRLLGQLALLLFVQFPWPTLLLGR
jgi:hypothetical protein